MSTDKENMVPVMTPGNHGQVKAVDGTPNTRGGLHFGGSYHANHVQATPLGLHKSKAILETPAAKTPRCSGTPLLTPGSTGKHTLALRRGVKQIPDSGDDPHRTQLIEKVHSVVEPAQILRAWKELTDYDSKKIAGANADCEATKKGQRALLRLYDMATKSVVKTENLLQNPDYVHLWADYGLAQSRVWKYNSSMEQDDCCEEAKTTFKYMKNEGIGSRIAKLYTSWAEFELENGCEEAARKVLQNGLKKKAQPSVDIEKAIGALDSKKDDGKSALTDSQDINNGAVVSADDAADRKERRVCFRSPDTAEGCAGTTVESHGDNAHTSASSATTRSIALTCTSTLGSTVHGSTTGHTSLTHSSGLTCTSSLTLTDKDNDTAHTSHTSHTAVGKAPSTEKKNRDVELLLEGTEPTNTNFTELTKSLKEDLKKMVIPEFRKPASKRNESATKIPGGGKAQSGGKTPGKAKLFKPLGLSGGAARVIPKAAPVTEVVEEPKKPEEKPHAVEDHEETKEGTGEVPLAPIDEENADEMSTGDSGSRAEGNSAQKVKRASESSSVPPAPKEAFTSTKTTGHTQVTTTSGVNGPTLTSQGVPSSNQVTSSGSGDKSKVMIVNGKKYAILEVIGKGGSSKVYKVMGNNRKIYALKKVKLEGVDSEVVDGFINEIELLKKLQGSEYVVQLIDAEVNLEAKYIFMVMEFGDTDLARMLQRQQGKPFNENYIKLYWQQMLEAVHAAHEHRIIHADLKPANFLCVEGRLKLIDFGIAKAMKNDTTNVIRENQVGTLNYMSPEALLGEESGDGNGKHMQKLGRASDVWALGCILYQMVYGRTPFAHLNLLSRLRVLTSPNFEVPFPKPGEASVDLPADSPIIDVIRKCLMQNSKARPSIPELLDSPFVKGGSTHAKGPAITKELLSSLITQLSSVSGGQGLGGTNANNLTTAILQQIENGQNIDISSLTKSAM